MSEKEEDTTPALFFHCVEAYEEMLARAQRVTLDEGTEGIVYEGFITALFRDVLKYSSPYFSSVTQALTKMGCARQLKRGGSSTPSQWIMITEPTPELFAKYQEEMPARVKYVTVIEHAGLEQRVKDLTVRVSKIDAILAALIGEEEELVS
jgi:hypothetical protein